ncbi:lysophospholipid acyltransferase family protein [Sedimentitalea sp. JM2-8]|uniref:Lysophospholipid acyltransferase family protein n=1 Tax=Sedimentitalea xiamensis TaxID=3050037 RepID=A0ABT7FGD7_9RHOB|nr:lysophospholipid acyltransferase family protein [Sedimentitalea xiamensis]MDK3074142.1 lysophospholipid acyltransferase family protein [Sedimentitalea xiamensis]
MPADFSDLSRLDRAKYFAANLFLRGLIGLIGLIPYHRRIPAMGWLVSRVMAPLAGFDRRVRDNLQLARPDLADAEVRRLCKAVPDNAGRTLIELYAGRDFIDRARAAPVSGPGLSALERAREEGRPVILMTGHFGNYDAARANLIGRGHKMGALYRRMANPYFNEHYVRTISSIGTPMFEQGRRGMVEMVRHLKAGGIIAIVGDLHVQDGTVLNFFGQPANTSTVPAELALRHDAALIPVYAIRQPNGLDFAIVMHAPIEHSDAVTMTQAINDGLEELVRAHMDQWFWIHRRWKG